MSTCRCRLTLLLAALLAASWTLLITSTPRADSVAFQKRFVHGARTYVITANLNDPQIKIDIGLPSKGLRHSERFSEMVRRRAPVAAVTGTYFDTRSLLPVGTIVAGGKAICVSHIGTAVCFNNANEVKFIATAKGESCEFSDVDCGVRTGPRLLANGAYVLNPRREGFRHPGLFGSHKRIAMGVTMHNKLLLVAITTPVTFAQTASVMKALGAVDAVCLDGGTSSAMYYKGRLVCNPGRQLTNIVEVYKSPVYANRTVPAAPITAERNAAATGPQTNTAAINASRPTVPATIIAAARFSGNAVALSTAPEQAAAIPEPYFSSLAKCWRTFGPINRAKLSGLKGFEHTNHFVHVSTNAKIVNHLVS